MGQLFLVRERENQVCLQTWGGCGAPGLGCGKWDSGLQDAPGVLPSAGLLLGDGKLPEKAKAQSLGLFQSWVRPLGSSVSLSAKWVFSFTGLTGLSRGVNNNSVLIAFIVCQSSF